MRSRSRTSARSSSSTTAGRLGVPRRAPIRNLARARTARARAVSRRRRTVPEPLGPRFTPRLARRATRARERRRSRRSLLDQRGRRAGSGTSMRDEALWRGAAQPAAAGERSRSSRRSPGLTARSRAALRAGHRAPGSRRLRDYAATGRRCRLDARRVPRATDVTVMPVPALPHDDRKTRVGGRGTWYCPRCQPLDARAPTRVQLRLGPAWGATLQDGGGRAAVVPLRRGRPHPPLVHGSIAVAVWRYREGVIRKTKSRFGARLEPFSHVELLLHQGSGELHTVDRRLARRRTPLAREDPYRLSVGLVGAEAMLRSSSRRSRTSAPSRRSRDSSSAVDALAGRLARSVPALDPLALAFQLKLLWLSGYVPHLELRRVWRESASSSATCREPAARCARPCAPDETVFLSPEGFRGMHRAHLEPARRRRTSSGSASGRCGTRSR